MIKVAAVMLLAATVAACTTSGYRMTTGGYDPDSFGCGTAHYARTHPGDCSPH